VLPPDDNLLQSARRRHRAVTQERQPEPATAERAAEPAPEQPAPPRDAQGEAEAAEPSETETAFPVADVPAQPPQEDEFDSPWLK